MEPTTSWRRRWPKRRSRCIPAPGEVPPPRGVHGPAPASSIGSSDMGFIRREVISSVSGAASVRRPDPDHLAATRGANAPASAARCSGASRSTTPRARSGCRAPKIAASVPPREWPTTVGALPLSWVTASIACPRRGSAYASSPRSVGGFRVQPLEQVHGEAGVRQQPDDARLRQEIPDVGALDRGGDQQQRRCRGGVRRVGANSDGRGGQQDAGTQLLWAETDQVQRPALQPRT